MCLNFVLILVCVEKKRPISYTIWYQLDVSGGSFFKFTGVITTPVNRATEKGLVRRGFGVFSFIFHFKKSRQK